MVKLETHLHTREISRCGKVDAAEMMRLLHEHGYDAVVVTDHFLPGQYQCLEARERFLTGYHKAAETGAALGITVLPGMELRFDTGDEDFLVYGMLEEEILSLPDGVCEKGLHAMHDLCQQHGWLIYQAHPYRPGLRVMPFEDLDGVETRNCNPRHNSHNDLALAYAQTHHLLTICGSDAHQVEDVGGGGIYVSRDVLTPRGLAAFLRENRHPEFVLNP